MKNIRLPILAILILLLSYVGFSSYRHATLYEKSTTSLADKSDATGLAQEKLDKLTSLITFGIVKNETKIAIEKLQSEQAKHKAFTLYYLYAFLFILALIIIIGFSCSKLGHTLILAIGSLIALILGLISPTLMITIHKNINYLGDIVLSFESKSILSSITKLMNSGELAIALAIFLFSVLIPLLKINTLIIALIAKELHIAHRLIGIFKYLGKWSMTDVFVVATLLVYLSSNNADLTHAEVGVGVYFFLIYVLLSMVTTLQTQKVLETKSPS